MKIWKRFALLLTIAIGAYVGSYAIRRSTKLLVRREWLEVHPHTRTHCREIHGTDIGQGRYFNANFKPKDDPFRIVYYPLWQAELRIRGKYYRHEDLVPNGVGLRGEDGNVQQASTDD